MAVHVWRVETDTPDHTADDMPAAGARRTGGRWPVNAERETPIKTRQAAYLNIIVEQDHRAIKRRTRPMSGLNAQEQRRDWPVKKVWSPPSDMDKPHVSVATVQSSFRH